jgi:acetolactate synthase-1/2/3 large subunit
MDGGERVARVLDAHGVPFVFTLVGGHISPILVAAKRHGIRVVDVRHEATAVFAADAVGRLTGTPGVAAVTAGPGVTNAVTAVKNAALAQAPMVLLGGATATLLEGRGALQDIDQVALLEPHVKWLGRPAKVRDVVPAVERAFHEAADGVPGPVFVELAIDLLYSREIVIGWAGPQVDPPPGATLRQRVVGWAVRRHLASVFARSDAPSFRPPRPPADLAPSAGAVRRAAAMLASAERPVLVLGSQAVRRPDRARTLATAVDRLGLPVWLSGMARGLLGAHHPLLLRHARRDALKRADVVVLAGVPNDFRLDYGRHLARARVIGINLSAGDLRKNRRPDLGILADPHLTLSALAELTAGPPSRDAWWAELREREARRDTEIDALAAAPSDGRLNPLALCRSIDAALDDDSVLVGDGGDFVATASYTVRPRGPLSWLDPGVFGTLGVGAGFALAAKLVRPDADVWLLWGDGAAGYSIVELDTFVRHGLPIVAVVGNDAAWTQILRDQQPLLGDDVACRLAPTDYHVVADGLGAKGFRVSDPEDVAGVLAEAVTTARAGTPVLVNALLAPTTFRQGSISV